MLDTRIYDVIFSDGDIRQYSSDVIAESMYLQVDDEGRTLQLLDSIVDPNKSKIVITKEDTTKCYRHTTKGWLLLVQWKNRSSVSIPLKDLKASNPAELAEYAESHLLR